MAADLADEPLLTDEETHALLDAMREEEIRETPDARPTDLGSPEGPLREAMGRADACIGHIGQAAKTQLLRQTAQGVEVQLLPAEIVPRDVLAESIDPAALRYSLNCRGHLYGLLVVFPQLATYILDRSMGAAGGDDAASPVQGFSKLDRRIVRPFPKVVADTLGRTFLEGLKLELVEQTDPDEPQVRFEPMLRLGLRFTHGGMPVGEVLIALTAAAVGSSQQGTEPRAPRPDAKAQVAGRITNASVDIVAVLGRTPSSVRALLSLGEGDILRLDLTPDDPVTLRVGDVVVGRGHPVVQHGNLAIEITEQPSRTP